jgi:hypothetical protein
MFEKCPLPVKPITFDNGTEFFYEPLIGYAIQYESNFFCDDPNFIRAYYRCRN